MQHIDWTYTIVQQGIHTGAALDWLARTHVNLGLLYYRDKDRRSSAVTKTLLAQLHLYF